MHLSFLTKHNLPLREFSSSYKCIHHNTWSFSLIEFELHSYIPYTM